MAQINKPSEYFNTVLYTGNGTQIMLLQELDFNQIFSGVKKEVRQVLIF
jgi:hypothetical protein